MKHNNISPLKKKNNKKLIAELFVAENTFVWVCFWAALWSSSEPSSGRRCVCEVNYTEWSCSTTSGSTHTAGKTRATGDASLFMPRPTAPALLLSIPKTQLIWYCRGKWFCSAVESVVGGGGRGGAWGHNPSEREVAWCNMLYAETQLGHCGVTADG